MVDAILKIFGWYCEPSEALPVPTKTGPKRGKANAVPDGISFDSNGRSFQTTFNDDGLESVEVTIGRNPSRTVFDDEVLSMTPPQGKPTLNANKYFRLKMFWAKGLSAKAVARTMANEKGYSLRTLEYYWERFSLSQRMETERRGAAIPYREKRA